MWSPRPSAPPATLGRLRDRVSFVGEPELSEAEALAAADVVVLASDGVRPMPGTLLRALGAGAVPVASRLPVYEEILAEGEHGLLFEPGEVQTLAAHLERLLSDHRLLARTAAAAATLRSALELDAGGRRARGRSTPGWPPAATLRSATSGCAPGWETGR